LLLLRIRLLRESWLSISRLDETRLGLTVTRLDETRLRLSITRLSITRLNETWLRLTITIVHWLLVTTLLLVAWDLDNDVRHDS